MMQLRPELHNHQPCLPNGLDVERDRNLKDKTIIGFFIYIEYLDQIIRKALAGDEDGEEIDGGSEEI